MTARSYKVICISIYDEDLAALDAKVAALKSHGMANASRSKLIRAALAAFDAPAKTIAGGGLTFRSIDSDKVRVTVTDSAGRLTVEDKPP